MMWIVGWCKCRVCDAECVSIMPADIAEPNNTECHKCGNMTSELIDEDEEETDV